MSLLSNHGVHRHREGQQSHVFGTVCNFRGRALSMLPVTGIELTVQKQESV